MIFLLRFVSTRSLLSFALTIKTNTLRSLSKTFVIMSSISFFEGKRYTFVSPTLTVNKTIILCISHACFFLWIDITPLPSLSRRDVVLKLKARAKFTSANVDFGISLGAGVCVSSSVGCVGIGSGVVVGAGVGLGAGISIGIDIGIGASVGDGIGLGAGI